MINGLLTAVIVATVLGIIVGYVLRYVHARYRNDLVELDTKKKLLETERTALQIIEKAEQKAEEVEHAARADRKAVEQRLEQKEERLDKREEFLDERQIDLDSQKESLQSKIDEVKRIRDQLQEREQSVEQRLEEVAGLDKATAYEQLLATLEKEHSEDLNAQLQKLDRAGEEVYEARAQELLLSAMHRLGNNIPSNFMTANVEIPNDDIKGKVIGREGRNVRTFERMTGVDVLIDDVPGYITLSSFDPIRREIARIALEQLVKDGRIQPARIEQTIQEAQQAVSTTIRKMGEQAAHEVDVKNLHPDLLSILGRLYFRTSYGQNVLQHSVEMAHLAGILAQEIGANAEVARAGALLHDIGKTMSHEVGGSHVEIGIRIMQKYDVDPLIIKAMQSHHEEYPYETPESILVQIADSISGSRPGARRDSIENYIKRLTELEAIATGIAGVEKAFAISAGREIRVLVDPESLSDFQSNALARTIARTIEQQLRYPGEIKVHVIRETRIVSYAR